MILALVSDSHGHLPPALFSRLAGCELILHLGDLGPLDLIAELAAIAPTLAVRGNTDPPGLPELPEQRRLEIEGLPLALRHHPWTGKEPDGSRPGLWAHGHVHVPSMRRQGRAWLICPGALYKPRQGYPPTLAVIEIRRELIQAGILAVEDGRVLAQNAWSRIDPIPEDAS